jgi:hypothetical protein
MRKGILKRLLAFMFIILWLAFMAFPIVAFLLATQGEIQLGDIHRSNLRIFLVQESDNKGVGFQWSRSVSGPGECLLTSLNYILWEGSGKGQSNSYCICYGPNQDDGFVDCP